MLLLISHMLEHKLESHRREAWRASGSGSKEKSGNFLWALGINKEFLSTAIRSLVKNFTFLGLFPCLCSEWGDGQRDWVGLL